MKGWEWLPSQCCAEPDLPDGLTVFFPPEAFRIYRKCRAFVIQKNETTWHLHA